MKKSTGHKVYVKNKRKYLPFAIAGIAVILICAGLYNGMCVKRYYIDSEKITEPITFALVADLHSCSYGVGCSELIEAIDKEEPDAVMMSGDIFDDELSHESAEAFIAAITEKYPCYYVTGNHEYWGGKERYLETEAILSKYNIIVLAGEAVTAEFKGEKVNICGVEDPGKSTIDNTMDFQQQLYDAEIACDNDYFTVLLSHRPEYFEKYTAHGFDLVLSGHAHGGQWRIPVLLNGLYAPDQGLFPEYAGGCYHEDNTTMVVSRGLARETTRVPRFCNRPELVIIEIG